MRLGNLVIAEERLNEAPFARTALLIVDLQNDFLHPEGAYARGGQTNADIAALAGQAGAARASVRAGGGFIVSTHFTLVPGRGGEPLISPHLKALRPFLRKGDFAPGAWGHALVDELAPSDFQIEKIAYSAFYMTRLEWVLRKTGIDTADRRRHRHQWRRRVDGARRPCRATSRQSCSRTAAPPSTVRPTQTAIAALKPVARIATIAEMLAEIAHDAETAAGRLRGECRTSS